MTPLISDRRLRKCRARKEFIPESTLLRRIVYVHIALSWKIKRCWLLCPTVPPTDYKYRYVDLFRCSYEHTRDGMHGFSQSGF
jgi:hypothetical protein